MQLHRSVRSRIARLLPSAFEVRGSICPACCALQRFGSASSLACWDLPALRQPESSQHPLSPILVRKVESLQKPSSVGEESTALDFRGPGIGSFHEEIVQTAILWSSKLSSTPMWRQNSIPIEQTAAPGSGA